MADTSIYPPISDAEIANCHGITTSFDRIVITEYRIFARQTDGGWIELKPLAQMDGTIKLNRLP